MVRRATRRATALAVATVVLGAGAAHAGNADRFYLGGDAALQGGAITATARGGGAIWYNPAGLAHLPDFRFDVSVSAYALRFGAQPNLTGDETTRVTRLTNLDLTIAPAALTLTKRLGRFGVGFGVFVPTQDTLYLRTEASTAGNAVDLGVDFQSRSQDYFFGPSAGVSLAPGVDVGASLLFNYRSTVAVAGVGVGAQPDVSLTSHSTLDWIQLGVQPSFGVQLRPAPRWSLGFNYRLPALRLYEVRQTVSIQTVANVPGLATHSSTFDEFSGISGAAMSPARMHAGVAYDFDRARVALDLSYQARLRSAATDQDLAPVVNARLGGRYRLSPVFAIGGGLFTDRSAAGTPRSLGEARIDYYGVTAAIDIGTPYGIATRDGKPMTPPGKLVFGTTVALSYALGVGTVVRGELGTSVAGLYREAPADVTAHEILLHFGSTLME